MSTLTLRVLPMEEDTTRRNSRNKKLHRHLDDSGLPLQELGALKTVSKSRRWKLLRRLSTGSATPPYPGRVIRPSSSTMLPDAAASDHIATTADHHLPHAMAANAVHWLQESCADDIIPKILAFAGPQTAAALGRTNRFWRDTLQKESTWRILCEELYKWKVGDAEPRSWAEHYRLSPCVPIDYPTVHKAMQISTSHVNSKWGRRFQGNQRLQVRPVRILLRPGIYHLKETITIESQYNFAITIQTMELPENLYSPVPTPAPKNKKTHSGTRKEIPEAPMSSSSSSTRSLRRLLSCGRADEPELYVETTEFASEPLDDDTESETFHRELKRAVVVYRSRRANEPVFRVRQGSLVLRHVDIQHHSEGVDIWNGNAAIQIQPPLDDDDDDDELYNQRPLWHLRPTCAMHNVHVTSWSGRGIVNIDGGRVVMTDCAIADCAATGLYVGGSSGSTAHVERTDVVRNGVGGVQPRLGTSHRRGATVVARGHSGVYLEQGTARIADCNISDNTLTGISAVSPSNAVLLLEKCDLIQNGTHQLEMPPRGTVARERSVVQDCQISPSTSNRAVVAASGRPRSGLAERPRPNLIS